MVLHLHAAHQNFILDNQTYYWNLTDDIIEDGLMQFDGPCLSVPTGPGLGVKLDPTRVRHYAEYHRSEVAARPRTCQTTRSTTVSTSCVRAHEETRMLYPSIYQAIMLHYPKHK